MPAGLAPRWTGCSRGASTKEFSRVTIHQTEGRRSTVLPGDPPQQAHAGAVMRDWITATVAEAPAPLAGATA